MRALALILTIAFSASALFAGIEGVVTASKLNLRVKPGTKYAQVAQVRKGDKLEIIKYQNDWYQVLAPQTAKVYVSASFVENGMIKKSVHLRSGPSVAFSAYRLAEPGEKVTVVDSSRKDWLRIAPPYGLTAWVSAKYVYVTPVDMTKLAEQNKEKPKMTVTPKKPENCKPAKQVATAEKSPKKNIESLPFMNSKGKTVTVEGYLVPLKKGSVYVTHAIATKVDGEFFPLCYLHSTTHNLKLWKKRKVTVTGIQRWVKGWQRPVVDVKRISPIM